MVYSLVEDSQIVQIVNVVAEFFMFLGILVRRLGLMARRLGMARRLTTSSFVKISQFKFLILTEKHSCL